jgi:chaperonin GroES
MNVATKSRKKSSAPCAPCAPQRKPPQLRLIDDRVMILMDDASQQTPGGILLPDKAQNKPQRGIVVAVGPGKLNPVDGTRSEMPIKDGMTVIFSHYAGVEVPGFDGYRIMRIDDVLAEDEDL